jgi:hypothetical protein
VIDRISIELTNRCGKACWFCYNASAPDRPTRWDTADVIAFAADCARNRVKAVSLGGGEPLEFPGVLDVLAALRGTMFRSLTTNGLLLDVAALGRAAPDKVHVSIHFPADTDRVIRQVHELALAGIASGVNLLVRASQLDDAIATAARVRDDDRIVYLPMRGDDTPSPDELGRVAGGARFQSMSCLMRCGPSPRFAAIGWDRHVAWCSYTRSRHPLAAPTHAALVAAIAGLPLVHCATPRLILEGHRAQRLR